MRGLGLFEVLILIVISFLFVFPSWKILRKMGYHGAWSLLLLVGMSVPLLFFLAFAKWPIERRL